MSSSLTVWKRRLKAMARNVRGARMVVKGLASTDHPLLAHIIPIRRCNLACEYCNEFDDFSKPVPIETMFRRIDKLAELGTSVITISGGEPLLHPELDDVIRRIREVTVNRPGLALTGFYKYFANKRIQVIGNAIENNMNKLEAAGNAYISDGNPSVVARPSARTATAKK